jgi:hypothetical protein
MFSGPAFFFTEQATSAPGLLLDSYTGSQVAYSVRKLSTSYSGSCMRVRRSSDSVQQDIGFDTNNELDQSALSSFLTTNSGFVVLWYDQSGNNNNLTQSTTTQQPLIYANGVCKIGTKPNVDFTADRLRLTSQFNLDQNSYISIIGRTFATSSNAAASMLSFEGGADNPELRWGETTDRAAFYWKNSAGTGAYVLLASATFSTYSIFTTTFTKADANSTTNTVATIYRNGAQMLNGSRNGNWAYTNPGFGIGFFNDTNGGTTNTRNCVIQELIIWNKDMSGNRSGIESDQNTYYTIY